MPSLLHVTVTCASPEAAPEAANALALALVSRDVLRLMERESLEAAVYSLEGETASLD